MQVFVGTKSQILRYRTTVVIFNRSEYAAPERHRRKMHLLFTPQCAAPVPMLEPHRQSSVYSAPYGQVLHFKQPQTHHIRHHPIHIINTIEVHQNIFDQDNVGPVVTKDVDVTIRTRVDYANNLEYTQAGMHQTQNLRDVSLSEQGFIRNHTQKLFDKSFRPCGYVANLFRSCRLLIPLSPSRISIVNLYPHKFNPFHLHPIHTRGLGGGGWKVIIALIAEAPQKAIFCMFLVDDSEVNYLKIILSVHMFQ